MLVKACGLRTAEELSWAHNLGYDFLGIVVEPKSKRYVCAQELEILWQTLPHQENKGQNKVGNCVLVAHKWQHLAAYARLYPQALLQCYDSYPNFVPQERRFMPLFGEEQWLLHRARQSAAYYLYDVSFGSGEWHGLPSWCQNKQQLFVAGGLNSKSLQQLAARERGKHYFGFDLSSGLEEAMMQAGAAEKITKRCNNA